MQFDPYKAFGCDMRSHFDGTLFRFPLRSEALAADSRISKQVRDCLYATLRSPSRPMFSCSSVHCTWQHAVQVVLGKAGLCAPELLFATSRRSSSNDVPQQVYTVDKMGAQLDSLASEAAALLLFLRNVERCEVLLWAPGESEPQLLHECCILVCFKPHLLLAVPALGNYTLQR